MDTLNTASREMYDSWTAHQKQMYHELKAMSEKMKKGTDPATMTQEQRNNPRWRIWALLHYTQRPMGLQEIRDDIHLGNITYTEVLGELNILVAMGKVAHNTHDWWVVDPHERPSIQ